MNAPLHPEVLRLREASPQADLPLASEGVQRYVWESRFGAMLIEVVDGIAYVNGKQVQPIEHIDSVADGNASTSPGGAR